jgi:hypothetical protein
MKATLWAAGALILGAAIGLVSTRLEFAEDQLPVEVTLASSGGPSGGGKIGPRAVVVSGERHDFGTMDRNAKGEHTFLIRNEGDEPLTLTTGSTTCKCTTFAATDDKVLPGKTAEVKLEWNANTPDAEFEQTADLHTNDPHRKLVQLSVHGHIMDSVRASSTDVHFSNVSANEAAQASVNLFAYRGNELVIEKQELLVKEQADWFNISFRPLSTEEIAKEPKATAGMRLDIELKSGLPIGTINQSLKIATNQNRDAPITIRIFGDVASDVVLFGPGADAQRLLVELPTFARATGHKQTVFLFVKGPYRDETELRIASVEPQTEFTATLGEPNRDNAKRVRYALTIEVPPNATPISRLSTGAFAQIRIATTHPDVKELTIKVRYVVPES